jgi:hypothetical protein
MPCPAMPHMDEGERRGPGALGSSCLVPMGGVIWFIRCVNEWSGPWLSLLDASFCCVSECHHALHGEITGKPVADIFSTE